MRGRDTTPGATRAATHRGLGRGDEGGADHGERHVAGGQLAEERAEAAGDLFQGFAVHGA